jgi:hypothetical protein
VAQATTTPNLKTISGNRIKILFGGQAIGLAQSVRFADNYALEDASGIGDVHVIEHVPSKATHTVAVTAMTLFTGNLRDQGITTINGDNALQGLVFDIVIYSRDTGLPMRSAKSCSFDSGTISVEAHRIVSADAQFKALDVTGSGL